MSPSRRTGALVALVAAALLATGCGGTVIDDDKAEDVIEKYAEDSLGKRVAAVDCPSDVEVVKGDFFACTLSLEDGGKETARVEILNEDADIGLTRLEPGK